ncbi:MAG: lipolytic protein family [Gemmatimonadetes bacterium]|nr:lipolytic protein family [Gemmatimonadota bacterium]
MFRLNGLTRVAAIGAFATLAGCESKVETLGPATPAGGDIFKSYISIGNSITAGYQSGGINDSTQRQSYAVRLASAMGTRFAYPSINMPGCEPPYANGLTAARLGNAPPNTCALRAQGSVTDILNNVAVPGARVLDPISTSTVASNVLTQLILGGKTQVQKALDAKPTFATIWIGNNDVLIAGLTGLLTPFSTISPGIVSTQTQFQASYDAMISQLTAGAPGIKGVLIGVVQVAGLPSMVSGGLIASSPTIQATLSAAAGTPVTIYPNCVGSTSLVDVPQLVQQIKAFNAATGAGHPPVVACEKSSPPFPAPVGDIFILDSQEQQTLTAAINAYNAYIKTKADAIGFAYYDPNPLFAAQRANGSIPAFPNFQSTTATYGALISLDGVHPTGAAHALIANDLISAINAKYSTHLTNVQ